jgi:hypothetical protein
MNRSSSFSDDEQEQDAQLEFRRTAGRPNQRTQQADYARRKRPSGYNGIHRRRNKRWTW